MDDTSETGRPKVQEIFTEPWILLCSFGHGLSNLRDTRVTRIGVSVLLFGLFVNKFCGKNRPGKHLGQAGAYVTWCLEFRFV